MVRATSAADATKYARATVVLNPPAADTTAPVISSVTVTPGSTSASINWTTNEPATSRVEFGLSASSLTGTASSTALATSHNLTISGLNSATTYYYRVRSADSAGNTATYPTSGSSTFATSSATNPPSGLFAHWQFSEGSGLRTVDSMGNTTLGTIYGAKWTPGKNGSGLTFDGIDDYVSVLAFDVPGSAITISAWFKADTLQDSDPRIISKAIGPGEQDHYFMLSTTPVSGQNRLRFRLKTGGTTKTLIASSGNVLTGQWVHAVARYNGSMMTLYLNGLQVGSLTATAQ